MKKVLIALALVTVLSGCSNTTGLKSIISKDAYDDSVVITMPSHANACDTIICTGMGAQWNSTNPNNAILFVNIFNQITTIDSAKISIDDHEYLLSKKSGYSDFDSFASGIENSKQAFIVDLALIRRIAEAKDARIKVYTSKGQMSDVIIVSGRDSKSIHALRRFLRDIDAK